MFNVYAAFFLQAFILFSVQNKTNVVYSQVATCVIMIFTPADMLT